MLLQVGLKRGAEPMYGTEFVVFEFEVEEELNTCSWF